MPSLISLIFNPDMAFISYALAAALLSSISFGVVGSYVVARRITAIAGAISHCVLSGIGFSLFMQEKNPDTLFTPLIGALGSAIVAALIIGFASLKARQREDTIINALWSVGMATGLLFIAKTSAYVDPMSFLFGNILMIGADDVKFMALLAIFILSMVILFYNKLVALCFDEDFLFLRGVPAHGYYFLLLILTALSIVLLIRMVGIVLLIAMLTLPASMAGKLSKSLAGMMFLAVCFSTCFTISGIVASFKLNLPTGPLIVIIAAGSYLLMSLLSLIIKRFKNFNKKPI